MLFLLTSRPFTIQWPTTSVPLTKPTLITTRFVTSRSINQPIIYIIVIPCTFISCFLYNSLYLKISYICCVFTEQLENKMLAGKQNVEPLGKMFISMRCWAPMVRFTSSFWEWYNKTFIDRYLGQNAFCQPCNQTVVFGLTVSGNNLVLGSDKTHVALKPSQ